MNVAIILGRLTRDPVIKASQSGMTIARFTLAVNRLNKKGQNQEADFINCVAFGKTAEAIGNYVYKGAAAFSGRQNPDRQLYQQERREKVYYRNLGEPCGVHREAF